MDNRNFYNHMKNCLKRYIWTILICLALPTTLWADAARSGSVEYSRGAVSARAQDGTQRILGKDQPLFEKDIVTTGKDSFAVLKLSDGSRITVRPDTVFGLEEYAFEEKKPSAIMRLFKGGLRALTGLISKRNPNNGFKLRTATAVVGVRGTEFDARLCDGDCSEETATSKRENDAIQPAVAGRVVRVQGQLTARSPKGAERVLLSGGPVYEGDLLSTESGGFAVVVFRDNSRITLQSDSRFQVEQYRYSEKKGGSSFFRLLRGGLRALSGLMAKRNQKSFKIGTPTAVVGVRGTAFDMRLCDDGDCTGEPDTGKAPHRPVAARVVRLKGDVTVQGSAGGIKRLTKNARVYEGDLVTTESGGFAVLVFRDDSRVTIQAETRFKVETYRYDTGKKGSVFFRLLKGGAPGVLRVDGQAES